MAHANIEERRKAVSAMLETGLYTKKDIKAIAELFDCSMSAISSDIIFFRRKSDDTIYPSKKVKLQILERDNYTCQYCGKQDKDKMMIDHVIPTIRGGLGYNYNLVSACQSCNILKGKNGGIWLPDHHRILKSLNPAWYKAIKRLSKPKSLFNP